MDQQYKDKVWVRYYWKLNLVFICFLSCFESCVANLLLLQTTKETKNLKKKREKMPIFYLFFSNYKSFKCRTSIRIKNITSLLYTLHKKNTLIFFVGCFFLYLFILFSNKRGRSTTGFFISFFCFWFLIFLRGAFFVFVYGFCFFLFCYFLCFICFLNKKRKL